MPRLCLRLLLTGDCPPNPHLPRETRLPRIQGCWNWPCALAKGAPAAAARARIGRRFWEGFALAVFFPVRLRVKAESTTLRKSTSIRSGLPAEYSAWNSTFQDWQIMRSRATRFVGGKLRRSAIEGRHPARFQFAQSVQNIVQVLMHKPEEDSAHQEAEAGERHHCDRLKIVCRPPKL